MRTLFRSSVTGRFVTRLWAKMFPWFSVEERDTRVAFRAEDIPSEWIEALKNADYSHLDSR